MTSRGNRASAVWGFCTTYFPAQLSLVRGRKPRTRWEHWLDGTHPKFHRLMAACSERTPSRFLRP